MRKPEFNTCTGSSDGLRFRESFWGGSVFNCGVFCFVVFSVVFFRFLLFFFPVRLVFTFFCFLLFSVVFLCFLSFSFVFWPPFGPMRFLSVPSGFFGNKKGPERLKASIVCSRASG